MTLKSSTSNASKSNDESQQSRQPPALLFIGMAGSGKTSLMQRVNAYLRTNKKAPYILNLDPAVSHLPYGAHIDIRDTVHYSQVMKTYNLGPNGGILTSLNLFTTKFDQVLGLLDKRSKSLDYILIDTPGQIEIFTWSASGAIITETLASAHPTVVCYIIDTPRSCSPSTFMSNMLYACSILYKTKLPFVLLFNKTDVVSHEFAIEWMKDFEAFQAAVEEDTSYMGTLLNSMCLVLEEFYQHLKVVGVSAVTGQGMDELFEAINEAVLEYDTEYKPMIIQALKEKQDREEARKTKELEKLVKVMNVNDIDAINPSENDGEEDDRLETEEKETHFEAAQHSEHFEAESFQRYLNEQKKTSQAQ